jgi:integrase
MSFRVKKRGRIYQLEGRAGHAVGIRGRRGAGAREKIRVSLGTANGEAAQSLLGRIERALAEGRDSGIWRGLHNVLPGGTFARLASLAGYDPGQDAEASCTWADLLAKYKGNLLRRVALGELASSTRDRYLQACAPFTRFLDSRGIAQLMDIRLSTIEDFKAWRLARIITKKQSRGGRGIVLEVAILHGVFQYAIECDLVAKNPVKFEGRPGGQPMRGAKPFDADEVEKLYKVAGEDMLAFLLLRHTGLRRSDAVALTWGEIDWRAKEISRVTLKRKKHVIIPMAEELLFALENERDRRKPRPEDPVLLNPTTGRPLTRRGLYDRMLALGLRAGIPNAHPHRYRPTCAVILLAKGASALLVARMLGDTVSVIEQHYAPWVRELRDQLRRFVDSRRGLELMATQWPHPQRQEGKPN